MSCYCGRKDCETCNPSLLNRDLKGLRYETPKKEISIKALEEFVGSLDESKDEIIEPLTGYRDIDDFLRETLATMKSKGHDYRQGNDADLLHNFRSVADAIDIPMRAVWATYFYKHYSAVMTYVKKGQVESEPIEGRIKDLIVYLLLFYHLVQEEKNANHTKTSIDLRSHRSP
jgi:hypothetical protein